MGFLNQKDQEVAKTYHAGLLWSEFSRPATSTSSPRGFKFQTPDLINGIPHHDTLYAPAISQLNHGRLVAFVVNSWTILRLCQSPIAREIEDMQ